MGHVCMVQQLGCVRSYNWGVVQEIWSTNWGYRTCLNTGPSFGGKCAPCVYGPATRVCGVPQLGCVCMIQELWSYNWGSRTGPLIGRECV